MTPPRSISTSILLLRSITPLFNDDLFNFVRELDEILALSDRVIVMYQGAVTGELPIADCSEARLGMLMLGGAVQ